MVAFHLQAAEDFLVHLFEDAMLCAIHAKRVTLSKLKTFIVFEKEKKKSKLRT